jgi:hypothetical protein
MTNVPVADGVGATREGAVAAAPATGASPSTLIGGDDRRTGRPRAIAVLSLAFVVYLLLSIGLWWHVWSTHPTTVTTCGCGDPAFFLWFLAWPAHALSHGQNLFYSTLQFHPTGVNMLSNTSELLVGVPLAPVTLLFGPIATLNVASTLAPALSALAMFWLLRRWVRWTPAALIGGLVYGFSPFMLTAVATDHLMLGFLALPPLIVGCLDELLVRQRRPPIAVGAVLGILVTAQYFVSTEVLAIVALGGLVALVLLVAYAWLRDREDLIRRLPHAGRGLGAGAVVTLVLLAYPLWFTFAGPAHLSGLVWPTLTPGTGGLTPSAIWHLRFSTADTRAFHVLGGYLGPPLPTSEYLGLGLLVMLAVGLLVWRRDRRLWLFGALGAITIVLSLGVDRSYWVPWRLLAHVPLIQNILPSRFMLVTTLCVAVMLAIIVDRARYSAADLLRGAAGRWSARLGPAPAGALASLVGLGVAAVAVVPLATGLIGKVPLTVQTVRPPRWFAVAAPRLPPGQVVLTYPFIPSGIEAPMAWPAVDSLHFAIVGGGGPGGVPARAGRERPGQEVLSAASFSVSGPPQGTNTNVVAVRQALAGWGVTTAVVPDQSGLPRYERGTSPETALGLLTAAIGRPPEYRDDAWVWAGVHSPGAVLSVSPSSFASCTAGGLVQAGSRLAIPDCIIAASRSAS